MEVQNKKKNKAQNVKIGETSEVSDKCGVDSTPQGQKKRKLSNPCLKALLIEPSQGKTYAEVLGLLRSGANPEEPLTSKSNR